MRKTLYLLILASLFGMLLAFAPGCDVEDVGIPCTVGKISADIPIQLNEQALQCRSRLCIYMKATNAQSLCTKICEKDDDCPQAGEINTCTEGFACRYGTSVGGLSCCKMCVCRKFLSSGEGTIESSCKKKVGEGFSPDCPEL